MPVASASDLSVGNNCIPYGNSISMERLEGELERETYDQVDSGSRRNDPTEATRPVSSDSTQTDFDTIDSRSGIVGRLAIRNGDGVCSNGGTSDSNGCHQEGGLFSNLITMVLPTRRKNGTTDHESDENFCGSLHPAARNSRCVSTQTEQSPAYTRAYELCCKVIQELALETPIPSSERDEVFEALSCCVCEILDKHSILFTGMIRRFEVTNYRVFTTIANELFEASSDSSNFRITWGRIVSLFAFAVRVAQKYKEDSDDFKIDSLIYYLSDYIAKHLLDFVENDGGWEGLVKQFPTPDSEEKQIKRAMLWSGLCVGLVATMYVSSFLSK